MKTFFANCLAFFIALTAVTSGYASEINNSISDNLDANVSLYISEGTITNITSPVLDEIDTAFYIAGKTVVFINKNVATNVQIAYVKKETVQKKPSKRAVKTKEIVSKAKFKTLLATSKNDKKTILQFSFCWAASAPTVIKIDKTAAIFQNKIAIGLPLKQLQTKHNYDKGTTLNLFKARTSYALFSRPPTNLV